MRKIAALPVYMLVGVLCGLLWILSIIAVFAYIGALFGYFGITGIAIAWSPFFTLVGYHSTRAIIAKKQC